MTDPGTSDKTCMRNEVAVGESSSVERTVPANDLVRYREWLRSPSISTSDSPEMVIAWNMATQLGLHPTRVLRSLRKDRGYLAGEMAAVMGAVDADPQLVFRKGEGLSRRVDFVENGRRRLVRSTRWTPRRLPRSF